MCIRDSLSAACAEGELCARETCRKRVCGEPLPNSAATKAEIMQRAQAMKKLRTHVHAYKACKTTTYDKIGQDVVGEMHLDVMQRLFLGASASE
eukprot:5916258-Pyramimonas_sp.AAC.1